MVVVVVVVCVCVCVCVCVMGGGFGGRARRADQTPVCWTVPLEVRYKKLQPQCVCLWTGGRGGGEASN